MIDYRKLNDKIIIHCETIDEIKELRNHLGRARYPSSECYRFYQGVYGLAFSTGPLKHYQKSIGIKYKNYNIIKFKDILVPDKLTRFKNTIEVKFNDR